MSDENEEGLDLADDEFRAIYTHTLRGGALSLREKSNMECVLYDRVRGCTVYAQRPRQCRTWPFWNSVVHSEETWREEAADCPGMNHGALHTAEFIEITSSDDGTFD